MPKVRKLKTTKPRPLSKGEALFQKVWQQYAPPDLVYVQTSPYHMGSSPISVNRVSHQRKVPYVQAAWHGVPHGDSRKVAKGPLVLA